MRTRGIDVPVIMFSTLTHHGAKETIEGLALGAADYVTKPTRYDSPIDALEAVRAELVPRIKAIVASARAASAALQATRSTRNGSDPLAAPVAAQTVPRGAMVEAVVVGSSTGGPNALAEVISGLPTGLRVPVLVAQHMPPVYTTYLAQRLDGLSALTVCEAGLADEVLPIDKIAAAIVRLTTAGSGFRRSSSFSGSGPGTGPRTGTGSGTGTGA